MYSNKITGNILSALGLIVAVYVGVVITNTSTNSISVIMLHVSAICALIALINPGAGFFLLAVMAAYLDFIKRTLIFYEVNVFDVSIVLAGAPLTLTGIYLGLAWIRISQRRFLEGSEWIIFFIACALAGLAMLAVASRAGLGALQSLANTVAYIPLMIAVAVYFTDPVKLYRYLNLLIAIFTPVAIYGIYQACFGLSNFEREYLLSGLTIGVKHLDAAVFRPFSTLSSSHAYSNIMAIMFAIAYWKSVNFPYRHSSFCKSLFAIFLPLFFFAATITSLGRTAWFMMAFAVAATHMFKTGFRTVFLYASAIITFAAAVLFADETQNLVDIIDRSVPKDSELAQKAFNPRTFSTRIEGFRNILTNPEFHTPFGNPELRKAARDRSSDATAHDAVSQALVQFGLVGTGLFAAIMIGGLSFAHIRILRVRDKLRRELSIVATCVIFSVFTAGLFSGSSVGVYPINFLFWFCCGILASQLVVSQKQIAPGVILADFNLGDNDASTNTQQHTPSRASANTW